MTGRNVVDSHSEISATDIWRRLREHLDAAVQSGETSERIDRTQTERILKERARRFAEARSRQTSIDEDLARPVLMLQVDTERFAFDVEEAVSVLQRPRLTEIPGVPRHVRGVTMFSGRLISVLDLKALTQPQGRTEDAAFVMCVGRSTTVGVVCSGPGSVERLGNLRDSGAPREPASFGVGSVRGEPTTYVPIRYLLADPSVVVDQQPSLVLRSDRRSQ